MRFALPLLALVLLLQQTPPAGRTPGVRAGEGAAVQPATWQRVSDVAPKIDAELLLEDLKVLSDDRMEGRLAGSPGGARARAYVICRFKEAGLTSFGGSFERPFALKPGPGGKAGEGVNVVGYVEGKKNPGRFVVVTAHYDHEGVKGGEVYNGADDNASGVAVLLGMASHFVRNRPDNSIIFVATDAEEGGLLGARAFVRSPPVELKTIALNVNLDMVSRSDRDELYAAGASHYPALRPVLERVASAAPVKLLLGHDRPVPTRSDDWTGSSDHAPFHAAKIPFVYFGVEEHPDYHRPTDDFAKVNRDFFVRSAETILRAVVALDAWAAR